MLDGIPKGPVILEKVTKEHPVQRRRQRESDGSAKQHRSTPEEEFDDGTPEAEEPSHKLDIRA